MEQRSGGLRAGVYVDVENVSRHGGRGLRYDVLRDFACRGGAVALRLNAYLAYDPERAGHDREYYHAATGFHAALRDYGYKVIEKKVQWYVNDDGTRVSKANSDLDLAVDMLLQSAKLTRVVLVSGDGDFVQVVRALQNAGCRVELVAFESVSYALRCEADVFVSGFLVPGLVAPRVVRDFPGGAKPPRWGELDSRVRGVCRHYSYDGGYGFLRYYTGVEGVAQHDLAGGVRDAFFYHADLPPLDRTRLPNRDMIFEFTLVQGREPGRLAAKEITLVHDYAGGRQNRSEPRGLFDDEPDEAPAAPETPV